MSMLLRYVLKQRQYLIAVMLCGASAASLTMAFLLRFEYFIPEAQQENLRLGLLLAIPIKMGVCYLARLHRGWFSMTGLSDLLRIAATSFGSASLFALCAALLIGREFPRSIYLLDAILFFFLIAGARVGVRMYLEQRRWSEASGAHRNILICGEQWATTALIRDLQIHPELNYHVLGVLDDNSRQNGESLMDVPVVGSSRDATAVVEKFRAHGKEVHEIIIALPSASSEQLREAALHCRASGVACKTLPALNDLLGSKGLAMQLREISVEDLLARAPVELANPVVRQRITGQIVLVTGAGGFIGSELCRQVASCSPARLVLLDQAESPLFNIHLELAGQNPDVSIIPVLADIRDAAAIEEILHREAPRVVFHAAAYKHVPVMEAHPVAAAHNNTLGTRNLVEAALRCGVESLVLISTDKAVNPTSVMGASKRAAELVVAGLAGSASETRNYVSVRFGNVLASTGSVIPIFQSQIARGGPVTVTHPEIRRYFMTVREAVQLVLHAFALAKGNEIFVLDMGQPVRIVDLARTMISLAGLVPDRDIPIEFTGLRPGEKLFEEINLQEENFLPTPHPKIHIFQHRPLRRERVVEWLEELSRLVKARSVEAIPAHFKDLIPEYDSSSTGVIEGSAEPRAPIAGR